MIKVLLAVWVAFAPCWSLAASPDFSGIWLPVPSLSTPWPTPLPLTGEGRQKLMAFQPDRDEPAGFCMPLGTPRNTLSGTSPLEVLQTADRVYFVFQPDLLNAETRRVYLDGRAWPKEEDRIPTWLGVSRGRWGGTVLHVETRDMEPQAILNGDGLAHSGQLVAKEQWRLGSDPVRGRILINDLELTDAAHFAAPIRLRRVFAAAPDTPMVEGRCSERLWIDGLWRQRLAEHAAARRAAAASSPSTQAAP